MDISSIEDITTSELGNDEVNIKITIDPILRTPNYNILNIDNLKDYYNLLRYTNYNSKKKFLIMIMIMMIVNLLLQIF